MPIKLVAIDIDGTLCTSQGLITPAVFAAIQEAKAAGVHIVITTGRPILGVKKLLEELELTSPDNYVITFNGGLVQEVASEKILVKETLSYDDYLGIELTARKLGLHMHAITKDGIYTANRDIGKYTVHEAQLVNMPLFYRTPDEMIDKEIIKIMFVDEPDVLEKAITNIPETLYHTYNLVKSAPFYLEVVPKTVSKGLAVKALSQKLGIAIDETMAIGDEENDRSMLEIVGCPVVMENGNPSLKPLAKYITKSNNDSGVAYAIRKWVL